MQTLFLDIESIPSQRPDVIAGIRATEQAALDAALAAIRPPGTYKKAESIDEWMATEAPKVAAALRADFDAKVDATYRKTGLDGAFGQVFAVGFALGDGLAKAFAVADLTVSEEAALLAEFYGWLEQVVHPREHLQTCVVGHNVANFDLRFLLQRSIVHGIRPHTVIGRAAAAKPWEQERVYDTMVQWSGVGQRASLDKLCRALGLPGKDGFDGSMVWDAVKAGDFAKVAEYCKQDVIKVRDIYKRMTFRAQPFEAESLPF